jgi:hypothetical protein
VAQLIIGFCEIFVTELTVPARATGLDNSTVVKTTLQTGEDVSVAKTLLVKDTQCSGGTMIIIISTRPLNTPVHLSFLSDKKPEIHCIAFEGTH